MSDGIRTGNPFQIKTPEYLTAAETVSLFVDVFTDLQKIIDPGHVFLVGPRGTGKSMMFRYLQPDCQCAAKKCNLEELPFLGVYVPLKDTNFSLAELGRFEHRHASDILSEHILATRFAVKIFKTLAKPELYDNEKGHLDEIKEYFKKTFLPAVGEYVSVRDLFQDDKPTIANVFLEMASISEELYNQAFDFVKRLAFRSDFPPYEGPLCDYSGFLLPVISALSELTFFPSGPIYLLVDDAHWLSRTQTMVLNSWVATRTSGRISFKVSTQYNYKTYYTLNGATIDSPHDYSEIDITTIYTGSRKSKYRERVSDIVEKRLVLFNIEGISAKQFFPDDEEQEREIEKIAEEYKQRHDRGEARGYYRSDDALRYARPDFIKGCAGQRKSSYTYSYAGFEQLVHLSSGVVRSFLEPAHRMYAEMKSRSRNADVAQIPPSIQDEVVREYANEFLFTEMERLERGGHDEAPPREDVKKLANLIQGLGGVFRQILLSDRSERRVFSIAFSDEPSEEVSRILDLGVQLGYFHKSTIGRKDSRSGGRTRLYVLNRCLAPIWTLDPTGFAGYLFVQSVLIEEAIKQPYSMLRRLGSKGIPDDVETVQLELF